METLKRYQFFCYYVDDWCAPSGGAGDIVAEADTLEEAIGLFDIANEDEFYWLDLVERRWSTEEEEKAFRDSIPKEPPKQEIYQNLINGFDRSNLPPPSGTRLPEGLFQWVMPANFVPKPDLRTADQKREDFLRSCHIKYTK